MKNIVKFEEEKERITGPIRTTYFKKETKHTCLHDGVQVSEVEWAVYCKECGEKIDPIEILLGYARKQRITDDRAERMQRLKEELEKIVSEWNFTTREKRRAVKASGFDLFEGG